MEVSTTARWVFCSFMAFHSLGRLLKVGHTSSKLE